MPALPYFVRHPPSPSLLRRRLRSLKATADKQADYVGQAAGARRYGSIIPYVSRVFGKKAGNCWVFMVAEMAVLARV